MIKYTQRKNGSWVARSGKRAGHGVDRGEAFKSLQVAIIEGFKRAKNSTDKEWELRTRCIQNGMDPDVADSWIRSLIETSRIDEMHTRAGLDQWPCVAD